VEELIIIDDFVCTLILNRKTENKAIEKLKGQSFSCNTDFHKNHLPWLLKCQLKKLNYNFLGLSEPPQNV
jgi:hypothetical protein